MSLHSSITRLCLLPTQENQDQLFHRVAGICGPAGLGFGDAVRRHRADPPELDLRGNVLSCADVSGRPADHCLDPAPLLHRPGQVSLFACYYRCYDMTGMCYRHGIKPVTASALCAPPRHVSVEVTLYCMLTVMITWLE